MRRGEQLIREALDIGRATMPSHPVLIDGLIQYADEMVKQARIEDAERLYQEAIERGQRRGRTNSPDDHGSGPSTGWSGPRKIRAGSTRRPPTGGASRRSRPIGSDRIA
jgi:hypothetical protein